MALRACVKITSQVPVARPAATRHTAHGKRGRSGVCVPRHVAELANKRDGARTNRRLCAMVQSVSETRKKRVHAIDSASTVALLWRIALHANVNITSPVPVAMMAASRGTARGRIGHSGASAPRHVVELANRPDDERSNRRLYVMVQSVSETRRKHVRAIDSARTVALLLRITRHANVKITSPVRVARPVATRGTARGRRGRTGANVPRYVAQLVNRPDDERGNRRLCVGVRSALAPRSKLVRAIDCARTAAL